MTRKIAVANAKGGVGKTTTAINLAYGIAEKGNRVLLIDCDTQGQVAKFLDVKPDYGLFEFVTGKSMSGVEISKKDAVYPARKNLWLLSGGISLGELKHWVYDSPEDKRQQFLSSKLIPKAGSLDFIIFDCAPGWDLLSVNILNAANEVICPVTLEPAAVDGLKTYLGYIKSAQHLNKDLQVKYILPTMFDKRKKQSHEILSQLQRFFGDKLCNPIHSNVRISEAQGHGMTVFEYEKRSKGANDYSILIKRVLKNGSEERNT